MRVVDPLPEHGRGHVTCERCESFPLHVLDPLRSNGMELMSDHQSHEKTCMQSNPRCLPRPTRAGLRGMPRTGANNCKQSMARGSPHSCNKVQGRGCVPSYPVPGNEALRLMVTEPKAIARRHVESNVHSARVEGCSSNCRGARPAPHAVLLCLLFISGGLPLRQGGGAASRQASVCPLVTMVQTKLKHHTLGEAAASWSPYHNVDRIEPKRYKQCICTNG